MAVILEMDPAALPVDSEFIINRLFEFSLSSNDHLCSIAVKCFVRFTNINNIGDLLSRLLRSNWMDPQVAKCRFMLLSKIAKTFKSEMFAQFVAIAIVELFDDEVVDTKAFKFLSRVPIASLPQRINDFPFRFIVKYFVRYTNCPIDTLNKKYTEGRFETPFLDGIQTDIDESSALRLVFVSSVPRPVPRVSVTLHG